MNRSTKQRHQTRNVYALTHPHTHKRNTKAMVWLPFMPMETRTRQHKLPSPDITNRSRRMRNVQESWVWLSASVLRSRPQDTQAEWERQVKAALAAEVQDPPPPFIATLAHKPARRNAVQVRHEKLNMCSTMDPATSMLPRGG